MRPSRPAIYALVPAALGLVGASAMWRAVMPGTALVGLGGGGVAGLAAGWLLARTWLRGRSRSRS